MAYITLANIRTYLGLGASQTGDDTLLTALIAAAQAEIESYCGRTFEASASTTKYYGPAAVTDDVLFLDTDCLTVTALLNGDGSTIASADYWLLPRNSSPKYAIRVKSTEAWIFDADGEVSVTGTWGYSTTADTVIQEATKEVAAYLYRLKDSSTFDVTAIPETGVLMIPKGMPAHVRSMLAGYRRRTT